MTTSNRLKTLAAALAIAVPLASAHAATLTYHGSLQDAGKPADGTYDIELTLYSAQSGGSTVAGPLTLYAVPVHAGNFSTTADFGARANGLGNAWVGVKVRAAGGGEFAALDQRSPASIDATTSTCSAWAVDGNSGNPAGSYLGNADNQPLVFEVNGVQLGILASSANTNSPDAPNVVFGSPSNSALGVGGATIAGGGRPVNFCGSSGNSSCANTVEGSGTYGTIGGGRSNTVVGYGATVLGGVDNVALGSYSLAAGLGAYALGAGQFVWADNSSDTAFGAVGGLGNPNEFDVRAIGGFNFVSGVNSSGTTTAGVHLAPGSGSWSSLSDRNSKSDLLGIDAAAVLARVVDLPISTWRYNAQAQAVRHIGPMAQDFYAAFKVGEDERHITEIDEGGVALAAIQGLNKKIEDENAALKAQNAALTAEVDQLAARMTKFEVAQGAAHAAKLEVAQQGE